MKITRKKEVIIERTRSVTIKLGSRSGERFCSICRKDMPFVTIDDAAVARQTTARLIFRLVEKNVLHFAETENGSLLICFASLSKIRKEQTILRETPDQN